MEAADTPLVYESDLGAYLGSGGLKAQASHVVDDPHFDVFDRRDQRLVLGKCSRLPDDEDLAAGRFGIDFHRGLPPFKEASGLTCDLGFGPVPVNACNVCCRTPTAVIEKLKPTMPMAIKRVTRNLNTASPSL